MSDASDVRPRTAAELAQRLAAERAGEPFLLVRDGEDIQRVIALSADRARLTIGRDARSDLALPWDAQVSRAHAELERVGEEWALSDQGLSRNGTYVNGTPVPGRRRLHHGDVVRVGETLILFSAPVAATPEVTVQADDALDVGELSAIQRRILAALCAPLVAGGDAATPATNQAIAETVHLSVDGVKSQLRTLSERFGFGELPQNRKRLALARRAVRAGFGAGGQPA